MIQSYYGKFAVPVPSFRALPLEGACWNISSTTPMVGHYRSLVWMRPPDNKPNPSSAQPPAWMAWGVLKAGIPILCFVFLCNFGVLGNFDNLRNFAIYEIWLHVVSNFIHLDLSQHPRTSQDLNDFMAMPKNRVKAVYVICANWGWLNFAEWAPFELSIGACFPQRCQLQDAPNGVLILFAN